MTEHLSKQDSVKRFAVDKVLSLLPLKPYHSVADIGCGTGCLTLPLARHLSKGKVFALDIREEALEQVRKKVAEEGVTNVEVKRCGELDFPLSARSLDGALLSDVVHETVNQEAFLPKVSQLVRPEGWIAIIEWQKKETASGPPLRKRLDSPQLRKLASRSGLKVSHEENISETHYFLLLEKQR